MRALERAHGVAAPLARGKLAVTIPFFVLVVALLSLLTAQSGPAADAGGTAFAAGLESTATAISSPTPAASPSPDAQGLSQIVDGLAAPPRGTPTPTPTATPTWTATPAATPTQTPSATLTPTPTPTGQASGTTSIVPNNSQAANPEATVFYSHTITNLGVTFDYKNVTASSSQSWVLSLLSADGVTPLTDHNSDGIPDTGRLNSGRSLVIVVKVIVPAAALANVRDVTTVTASSGRNPTPNNTASVTDTTIVNGVLSLTLSVSNADLGTVGPSGNVDPLASQVTGYLDDQGAYFVKGGAGQPAVRVSVTSNGPWSGGCWASENSGTAASLSVGSGYLQWSPPGSGAWAPLGTTAALPPYDNACFDSRGTGLNQFEFDYRLRVNWTDDPGTFSSVVTYAASQ